MRTKDGNAKQTIFFLYCNGCAFHLTQIQENDYRFSRHFSYAVMPESFMRYPAAEESVGCGEAAREKIFQLLQDTHLTDLCQQIKAKQSQGTHIYENLYFAVSCKSLQLDFEAGACNYPELNNPEVQLRMAQLIIQLSALFTILQQYQDSFNNPRNEARHGKAFKGLLERYFG